MDRDPDDCECSCHHKGVQVFCSCFGPCCRKPRKEHPADKRAVCRECQAEITSGEYAAHDQACSDERRNRPLAFYKRVKGAKYWSIDDERLTLWDEHKQPLASFDRYEERYGKMPGRRGYL